MSSTSAQKSWLITFAIILAAIPLIVLYMLSNMGGWDAWLSWIYSEQRDWQRAMASALSGLASEDKAASAWSLILGSALYGFLHAAGPGHGKVIMTTYLATNPEETRRGLLLTLLASLCQAVTAIILVYGLLYLVETTTRDTRNAVSYAERASYLLVIAMGLWLIWRAFNSARKTLSERRRQAQKEVHHNHNHHHHHDENCGCGHAHGPGAEELKQATHWRTRIGIILSIGLRPCTGAVLVLILAKSLNLAWAGVLSAFVMALGTAAAISCLAFFATTMRKAAHKALTQDKTMSSAASWLGALLTLAGGLILVAFGLLLLLQGPMSGSVLAR